MNIQRFKAFTALSTVICAALLATFLIVAIWLDFESQFLWKSIGSVFILFFLSALTHAIMQGMTEKPKEKE